MHRLTFVAVLCWGALSAAVAAQAEALGSYDAQWRGMLSCGPGTGGNPRAYRPVDVAIDVAIRAGKFAFEHTLPSGMHMSVTGKLSADGKVSLSGEGDRPGNSQPLLLSMQGAVKGNVMDGSGSWGSRQCTLMLATENGNVAGRGATASGQDVGSSAAAPAQGQVPLRESVAAQREQEQRRLESERRALEAEKQKLAQEAARFEQQRREEQARLAQAQLAAQQAKTAAAEAERQRQEAESLRLAALAKQQAVQSEEKRRKAAQLDFDPGRYFALVIGNNDYKKLPKLRTAIGDAKAVAKLLGDKYGFQVSVLNDATRYQILTALTKLRSQLKLNDNLLIYYAGHGVLDEAAERGYWLPVDADADNPSNWVSTVDLTDSLRAMEARHVMIVADSCYSGTLLRGVATAPRPETDRRVWLKRMEEKRSRTALTSGGLEPVMDGGGSGHSVFTKAFIDALADNNDPIDGQTLFGLIRRPVVLNADQTPAYADIRSAGHDGGDFVLVPAALRPGMQDLRQTR